MKKNKRFGLLALALTLSCGFVSGITPPRELARKVYGKITVVKEFGDIRVRPVDEFGDITVRFVDAFAQKPGEWEIVPPGHPYDFKIQYVDGHADFTVDFDI